MATVEERFKAALKQARRDGAKVRTNIQECCRGCVTWQKLGFKSEEESETTPLAWTYGGQGGAVTWMNGEAFYRAELNRRTRWYSNSERARVDVIWFNHSNGGAEIIAKAMKDQGFEVDWDGSEYKCVGVKVDERAPELEADDPLRLSVF